MSPPPSRRVPAPPDGQVQLLVPVATRPGRAVVAMLALLLPLPVLSLGAAAGPARAAPAPDALLDFTADERRAILAHGPWPPPAQRDAGNALSGQPAAIALGQRLFFDARLSGDGTLSCASCHRPELAFTDGRPRAQGAAGQPLDRHTPSLWNAAHERWYGWDGASDSLWSFALRPLLDPREMGGSAEQVARVIDSDAELACRLRQATVTHPAPPLRAPPDATPAQRRLVVAAKALGAFVATLRSGRTAFDAFRDALARGDRAAAARYPLAAQRGLRLFIGRGACATCHSGPMFSNGEFADIGRPFFVRPGVVDAGRHGGIAALQAGTHHLLSAWSDARADAPEVRKTRHVLLQHRNFGEFKVPSLRHVALTAPYMHDGSLPDLDAVIRHYSELDLERLHADGERLLEPRHFSSSEVADLKAFLLTLTDPRVRRWNIRGLPTCGGGSLPSWRFGAK